MRISCVPQVCQHKLVHLEHDICYLLSGCPLVTFSACHPSLCPPKSDVTAINSKMHVALGDAQLAFSGPNTQA